MILGRRHAIHTVVSALEVPIGAVQLLVGPSAEWLAQETVELLDLTMSQVSIERVDQGWLPDVNTEEVSIWLDAWRYSKEPFLAARRAASGSGGLAIWTPVSGRSSRVVFRPGGAEPAGWEISRSAARQMLGESGFRLEREVRRFRDAAFALSPSAGPQRPPALHSDPSWT
jgi:hypothetical protein